jgi:hypothetical protein
VDAIEENRSTVDGGDVSLFGLFVAAAGADSSSRGFDLENRPILDDIYV